MPGYTQLTVLITRQAACELSTNLPSVFLHCLVGSPHLRVTHAADHEHDYSSWDKNTHTHKQSRAGEKVQETDLCVRSMCKGKPNKQDTVMVQTHCRHTEAARKTRKGRAASTQGPLLRLR